MVQTRPYVAELLGFFAPLLLLVGVLTAMDAFAETVSISKDQYMGGDSAYITNGDLTAPVAGPWLPVGSLRTVTLTLELTDANDSVVSVDVYCHTTNDSADAVGTGNHIQGVSAATVSASHKLVATLYDMVWKKPDLDMAGVSGKWEVSVSNIPQSFASCTVALGFGVWDAGTDKIDVVVEGVTP